MKIQKSILGASLTAFVLLTGCTSGTITSGIVTTSGTALDGKIYGATVCVDANADETCNANETQTRTDINGDFSFATAQKGDLLLIGGTDIGTGKAFTGSLKAPAGSKVVSPLTTMVSAMVDEKTDAAAAETILKKALGIDETVALTSFDPFDKADATSQKVLAVQAEVQTIVHASSAAVAGAGDNSDATSIATAMKSVTKSLAASIKTAAASSTDGTVAISSTMVQTATDAAADKVLTSESAKAAVKAVSHSIATQSVTYATVAKEKVTNATSATLFDSFNAGMVVANTTLESSVKTTTADVKTKIDAVVAEGKTVEAALSDTTVTKVVTDAATTATTAKTDAETATNSADTDVAEAKQKLISDCTSDGKVYVDGVCKTKTSDVVVPTGATGAN